MKTKCFFYIILFVLVFSFNCFSEFDEFLMPPGLDNIHLGMDWKTFLSIRKNVEISNFGPDTDKSIIPDSDKPQDALTEKLSQQDLFDQALYGFDKGLLEMVMLGGELKSNGTKRNKFLAYVISKYKNPTRLSLMTKQKGHGVITWERDTTHINAILPIVNQLELLKNKDFISLQIMTREHAEKIKALGTEHTPYTTKAETEDEQKLIDSLKNEITTFIDNKGSR